MTNTIQIKNRKLDGSYPLEDSCRFTETCFCVADGVTRDAVHLPSGAKQVADLCCKTFVENVMEDHAPLTPQTVKNGFVHANREIARFNRQHIKQCDYLDNDWYSCVACGGIIEDHTLYWSAIGDCRIAVYDSTASLKFKTPNYCQVFKAFEPELKWMLSPLDWESPVYRQYVRKNFRNCRDQLYSYGVLTGENPANYYIHSGKVFLSSGDCVLFYSDGMELLLDKSESIPLLLQQKACAFAELAECAGCDDKTLIYSIIS